MRKNGLMTFICSFLLSLLTIFLADKALFRAQKNEDRSEIKISNNNITLFLDEENKIIAADKIQKVARSDLQKIADLEDIKEYAELLDEEKEIYEQKENKDQEIFLALSLNDTREEKPSLDEKTKKEFVIAETSPAFAERETEEQESKKTLNSNVLPSKNILIEKPTLVSSLETEAMEEKQSLDQNNLFSSTNDKNLDSIVEKTEKIIAEISNEKTEKNKKALAEVEEDFIPIQRNFADNSGRKINIKTKSTENEVAMVKDGVPIESMTKKETNSSKWQQMPPEENKSPWVVAKSRSDSSNFIPPETLNKTDDAHALELSKSLSIEPSKQEDEIKVAEMVRNILIPIPEDIINEGNVKPQLISSQKNKDIQKKIEQSMNERRQENENLVIKSEPAAVSEENPAPSGEPKSNEETAPQEQKAKKTILDSLSSIFSGEAPVIGITKLGEKEDNSTDIYKKFTKKSKDKNKVTKILPTEIKLSFQPNRAEISGPTLRWIEAFANKVEEDKDVILEVRIDGTSAFELQQKRLRLLHNILTNKGVEYSKINTVFTTREPNSFIIRAVRLENNTVERNNKEVNNMAKIYQNW